MAKRNKRTGAIDLDDNRTNLVYLKHAEGSYLWEQTFELMPVVKNKKLEKTITDMAGLIEKIVLPMMKSQVVKLAIDGGHSSYYLENKE